MKINKESYKVCISEKRDTFNSIEDQLRLLVYRIQITYSVTFNSIEDQLLRLADLSSAELETFNSIEDQRNMKLFRKHA